MLDYGKVQMHLYQQGKTLEFKAPPPPRVPAEWDPTSTGKEWDLALMKLGFDATVCDDARWIYSHAAFDDVLGVTIIVYFEDGKWLCDCNVDTPQTEDCANWDMAIAAPETCKTPLEVARWAKALMRQRLVHALEVLDSAGV